jgi:hypothetical protein
MLDLFLFEMPINHFGTKAMSASFWLIAPLNRVASIGQIARKSPQRRCTFELCSFHRTKCS